MNETRKNLGATVAGKNYIYIFGGANNHNSGLDTIEKFCIKKNQWEVLKTKIPNKIVSPICTAISGGMILIMGGSIINFSGEKIDKSSNCYIYYFEKGKTITKVQDLPKPLYSLYPAFRFDKDPNTLYLIDEDKDNENPVVFSYSIKEYLIQSEHQ